MADWFYDPFSNKLKTKVRDDMYIDMEGNMEVKAGDNLTWNPEDGNINRIVDPDNDKKSDSIFGCDEEDEF